MFVVLNCIIVYTFLCTYFYKPRKIKEVTNFKDDNVDNRTVTLISYGFIDFDNCFIAIVFNSPYKPHQNTIQLYDIIF